MITTAGRDKYQVVRVTGTGHVFPHLPLHDASARREACQRARFSGPSCPIVCDGPPRSVSYPAEHSSSTQHPPPRVVPGAPPSNVTPTDGTNRNTSLISPHIFPTYSLVPQDYGGLSSPPRHAWKAHTGSQLWDLAVVSVKTQSHAGQDA